MMLLFAIIAGFILDLLIGDPRWLPHPICLIGNLISSLQEETFAEGLFLLRKNWNCAIIYVSILSPNFVWCQKKEEAR